MNTGATMFETGFAIIGHQLVFQGMFVAKNIFLRRKIGKQIRGKNREATASIMFFSSQAMASHHKTNLTGLQYAV